MSTEDISRSLSQPRKRYSGVRMQQGRVLLDSDWNEHTSISNEDLRRTLAEIVCTKGSPNQGFAIDSARAADEEVPGSDPVTTFDFNIADGSFYLGGLRLQRETNLGTESFLNQSDWLQVDADAGNLPPRPDQLANNETRTDLIYLRAWEQCVTAVEDSELRERALGGPDTSVRVRRMQRIEVLTGVPTNCTDAFDNLIERLTAPQAPDSEGNHPFDSSSCELQSKANLTIEPDPEGTTEDPCRPAVPGGYLGADNQTIRVQLTATDRFIWGYDNAAPLYRVQVQDIPDDPAGARRRIKFLNLPRDQAAQPLAGQAVELIPWGALLPNQEKVAEIQGELFTVATSYDPSDNSLTIAEPVTEAWLEWLANHSNLWNERDPASEQQYLYLRLWTGGSGIDNAPDHEIAPGTPVPLAGTGLSVNFSDFGLPGAFWVAAARPHTPDIVVPWDLLDQAPPAGPRYFFAPLALINWRMINGALETTLRDCRQRFQPLCDARGCCTVTVGSSGQFSSIEEAIDWLPEGGGKICLLPGIHRSRAVITGRRNVTISGCDKQTRVIPREEDLNEPIFQIVDSQCITLEHMELVALGGTAVLMGATRGATLVEITVSQNRIVAAEYGIRVVRGRDINIGQNHIRMLDKEGALEAILTLAEDCRIERNDIGVIPAEQLPPPDVPGGDPTPDPTDPCAELELLYLNPLILTVYLDQLFLVLVRLLLATPFIALGGIRVAAASECVKILDNTIIGGAGNGITLGGSGLNAPQLEEDEPPGPVVDVIDNRFQGVVQQNGVGVSGATLVLASEDGRTTQTAVTGSAGYVETQIASGRYNVTAISPGQRISAAEPAPAGAAGLNRFTLNRFVAPDPDESIGFLYEIHIDDNEIAQMGLSGIGIPAPVAQTVSATNQLSTRRASLNRIAALLGFPVVSLDIHHNHIYECMRNPFDDALRDLVQTRGLGGISLGFCENVSIDNNRIERLGSTVLNPTCGIFVGFGERVTVSDNRVFDDRRPARDVDLVPGVRGGIVVLVTAIGVDELLLFNPDRNLDNGQHAGRIYDNVVYQMIGHSLRVAAIGSLSIHDNRFNTEMAGSGLLDRIAGGVLVLNLGGFGQLPEGDTLFNDNQCRLARGDSLAAKLIWTLDDLGYGDNQSSALAEGLVLTDNITLFANTFLIGGTLRATNNRFKEISSFGREGDFRISLISRCVLMNNTSNNQGDHCIFPFDTLVVDEGNQELDNRFCEQIQGSIATPVTGFSSAAAFDERARFRAVNQ